MEKLELMRHFHEIEDYFSNSISSTKQHFEEHSMAYIAEIN